MAETFKDAGGTTKYRKSTGDGSVGDPAVLHNIVDSSVLPTGAATEATLAALTTGCSVYSAISAAAVLSAVIKASAGTVHGIQCFNVNAAARFVRIYNQTGAPGSGDTPIWRGIIPGATAGAGFSISLPDCGIACSTGIGIRASAAIADNDTTALDANELLFNVEYK